MGDKVFFFVPLVPLLFWRAVYILYTVQRFLYFCLSVKKNKIIQVQCFHFSFCSKSISFLFPLLTYFSWFLLPKKRQSIFSDLIFFPFSATGTAYLTIFPLLLGDLFYCLSFHPERGISFLQILSYYTILFVPVSLFCL